MPKAYVVGDVVWLNKEWKSYLDSLGPWTLLPDDDDDPDVFSSHGVFCLIDSDGNMAKFKTYNGGSRCHQDNFERKDVFLSAASHAKRKELGEE